MHPLKPCIESRTSMVLAVARGLVYTLGFFRLVYWRLVDMRLLVAGGWF